MYGSHVDSVVVFSLLRQLCDYGLSLGHVGGTAHLNETESPTDVGQVKSERARVVLATQCCIHANHTHTPQQPKPIGLLLFF